MTAKPQWKNTHLQRSEVVTCSHGCMCMFAICFSNFVPFFFPKITSSALKHAYPHLLLALIGSQSLFFNNQPKLGISHNLIPFHPKQETPKDSGNPRLWCVLLFGLCVCVSVCLFCVCVWCCFWSLFLCFLVFCLVFLLSVTVHRTMHRSSTSLLRPLQQWPLRDLINQLMLIATCSQTCGTTWRKP